MADRVAAGAVYKVRDSAVVAVWRLPTGRAVEPALADSVSRLGKEGDTLRSLLEDGGYWHARAEEAWAIGEICSDPEAQRIMFEIADKYELLAERAAEREARTKH